MGGGTEDALVLLAAPAPKRWVGPDVADTAGVAVVLGTASRERGGCPAAAGTEGLLVLLGTTSAGRGIGALAAGAEGPVVLPGAMGADVAGREEPAGRGVGSGARDVGAGAAATGGGLEILGAASGRRGAGAGVPVGDGAGGAAIPDAGRGGTDVDGCAGFAADERGTAGCPIDAANRESRAEGVAGVPGELVVRAAAACVGEGLPLPAAGVDGRGPGRPPTIVFGGRPGATVDGEPPVGDMEAAVVEGAPERAPAGLVPLGICPGSRPAGGAVDAGPGVAGDGRPECVVGRGTAPGPGPGTGVRMGGR